MEEESKAKNKEAGVPKRGGGCSTDASTGGREGEREGTYVEGGRELGMGDREVRRGRRKDGRKGRNGGR